LPRRTTISRRSKSMSLTRSSRHSWRRRPAPYSSEATSDARLSTHSALCAPHQRSARRARGTAEHKGRARDRCGHAWWGSFRGRKASLAKWTNREIRSKVEAQAALEELRAAVRAGTFDKRGVRRPIQTGGLTFQRFPEIYAERCRRAIDSVGEGGQQATSEAVGGRGEGHCPKVRRHTCDR